MIDQQTIGPFVLSGGETRTIDIPADKSLTHRAIMLASCAAGRSQVWNPLEGEDCLATRRCFEALGVTFSNIHKGSMVGWEISSPGWDRWITPSAPLDCGNSGTTARLLLGLLAGASGMEAQLTGDDSLRRRPMGRVVDPLRIMGAAVDLMQDHLPAIVRGRPLLATSHSVGVASAQVKSTLLLAGARCAGETSVVLPAGSRDHTERWLRWLGASCESRENNGNERVTLRGPWQPRTFDYTIPGDPSSAAFFMVLGLLQRNGVIRLPRVGTNPTRMGFVKFLRQMGGNIAYAGDTEEGPEPTADIVVTGGQPLMGAAMAAEDVPTAIDEIPILAVAAACGRGISRFLGVGELRYKESNRLNALEQLLKSAGVKVSQQGDDLEVVGVDEGAIKAFCFDSEGDHRMAMAAAVLAKRADGPCVIQNASCVAVSFPTFFQWLL